MPHQGNSPADIIGYDGQGRPIYKGHTSSNGVRVNGNGNRNIVTRNGRVPMRGNGRMINNGNGNGTTADSNPVTRTFFAPNSPRYYKPNGQIVPMGAPLHQHQDGTIMTEHSMGPNDNSVVVTPSRTVRAQNTRRTNRARTNFRRRPTTNRGNRRTSSY